MQGLIRHNSFFCHCRGRVKSAALPWLHGCHAARHVARHAEGRGYGHGRVGGLNDEPSKRFGLTALAVMLWLIIAFKVFKGVQNGDLADGSLGPAPLFVCPSPLP